MPPSCVEFFEVAGGLSIGPQELQISLFLRSSCIAQLSYSARMASPAWVTKHVVPTAPSSYRWTAATPLGQRTGSLRCGQCSRNDVGFYKLSFLACEFANAFFHCRSSAPNRKQMICAFARLGSALCLHLALSGCFDNTRLVPIGGGKPNSKCPLQ